MWFIIIWIIGTILSYALLTRGIVGYGSSKIRNIDTFDRVFAFIISAIFTWIGALLGALWILDNRQETKKSSISKIFFSKYVIPILKIVEPKPVEKEE